MIAIKSWFNFNLLRVKISKIVGMPFLLLVIYDTGCDLSLCLCKPLTMTAVTNYLGIIVDNHLRWAHHISYLCSKIRKLIYKFVQLRSVFYLDFFKVMFLAAVQSIVEYGIVSWGDCVSTFLELLILIYEKIV